MFTNSFTATTCNRRPEAQRVYFVVKEPNTGAFEVALHAIDSENFFTACNFVNTDVNSDTSHVSRKTLKKNEQI